MRRKTHNLLFRLTRRIWRSFTHGYNFVGIIVTLITFLAFSIFVYDLIKNPQLTWEEKIKKAASLTLIEVPQEKVEEVRVEEVDKNTIACSDLQTNWLPGNNALFEGEKIKLRPGKMTGASYLKDSISSFFNMEIKLRSVMESGININLSFFNSEGELRYAIGDGDFKTVRYMFINNAGYIRAMDIVELSPRMDNNYDIGLKINTIEKVDSILSVATLTYKDAEGRMHTKDLKNLTIPGPGQLYLNVALGINASLEPQNPDAHIIMRNCNIKEVSPSKLLNI